MKGSCHCGNVQIEVSQMPSEATRCNCSICRRYAATWAFCTIETAVVLPSNKTLTYCWGDDRLIDFHHCSNCGCVTHYTSTPKGNSDRLAVNLNMFVPGEIADIRVRYFDGHDTWAYLN